jgi:hypothetical protein
MGLRWAICDLDGTELGPPISQRHGGEVEVPLDGIRRAKLNVSVFDPVAADVFPLARRLKAWLDGYIVFHGPLIGTKWIGESGVVQLQALGPGHQLERAFVPVPSPWVPEDNGVAYGAKYVQIDQSEIMARLMELGDITSTQASAGIPRHGIIRGSLPGSRLRDRSYEPGKQIYEAIHQLSQVIDGPDFDIRPRDVESGTGIAALDTYPNGQGADKFDSIEFHFNHGLSNCRNMAWEPDGTQVINDATVMGQVEFGMEPPWYRSLANDSLQEFGKWAHFEGRPDVSVSTTVEEHAQSRAAAGAFPPDILDIYPAIMATRGETGLGIPPVVGPTQNPNADCWLGDTIHAVGKQGYMNIDIAARITKVYIRELGDAGHVVSDLEVAPTVYDSVVT